MFPRKQPSGQVYDRITEWVFSMELNWVERLVVNNPIRIAIQNRIVTWMKNARVLPEASVILEIGCGRGAGARLLHKRFRPRALYGMDIDIKMLRLARRYLRDDMENTYLCLGDAESLPYKECSFDAVFGFGPLHHMLDWQRALREISRVLKPGGCYFLEEFYPGSYANFLTKRLLVHPEHNRFYSTDLKSALEGAKIPLLCSLEVKSYGIIGACVKRDPSLTS